MQSLEERLRFLQEAELLTWDGQNLTPPESPVRNRGSKLVSDLMVEMRVIYYLDTSTSRPAFIERNAP